VSDNRQQASDPVPSSDAQPRHGRARHLWWAAAFVALAIGVAVAVTLSISAPDHYAAFRKACLGRPGAEIVTLGTTVDNHVMGGSETVYRLGCRVPGGAVAATVETNSTIAPAPTRPP
jgi:hypothetical protein